MASPVRVKHEPSDVFSVETDSEGDDIDIDKLQPLAPKFASLSKFPVGCKVWYNLRCLPATKHLQAKSAHVEEVSIHFENGRRVYTVKSETSSEHKTSFYEDQLVYAISCPVKVTKIDDADETLDGVVVYVERQKGIDGRQQVTYAVQYSVENYIAIESGVLADRIKYRAEDSGMGVNRGESSTSIDNQIQTTCTQGQGIISVEDGGAKKRAAKEGKGRAAAKRRSPPKESAPAGLKAPPETSGADVIRLYQGGDAKELKEPSSAKTDSPRPQNQTALTASTQVSMSVNQQLPSTVQSLAAAGAYVRPQSSSTDPAAAVTTDAFPSKPRFNSTIRILSGEFAGLIGQITNIKIGGWCSIANPQVTKPIRMSNMEVLAHNDFPPPVVKRDATYSKRKFADVDVFPPSSPYGKRDSSVRRSKRGPAPNPRFHHDNDDEEDNNDEEEVVRPCGRRGRAAAAATPSSSSSIPGKRSIHLCKALTCPKFRQGSCQGYCTTCFKLFKPGAFDSHQQPQRGGSARNCRARKCAKFIQHNCEGYCMKHYREFVLEGGEEEEVVEEEVVVSPPKKRARRTIKQEVEEEEEEEEDLNDDNNDDESPFDDTPRTGRNGCRCRSYCKVKRCDKWSQGQPKNGMCFKHFRHYGFGDGTMVRPPAAATTPSKASSTSGKKEVSSPPKTWNVEEEEEKLRVDTGLSSLGEGEAVAAAAVKRRDPLKESAPVGLKSPPEKSNHSELEEPLSANTGSTFTARGPSKASCTSGKKSSKFCKTPPCHKYRQRFCMGYCIKCFKLFEPVAFDSLHQRRRSASSCQYGEFVLGRAEEEEVVSSIPQKREPRALSRYVEEEEEEEEEEELRVDTGLSLFGEGEAVAAAAAKRRDPPKESATVGLKSPPEKSNHSELEEPLSANTDSTFIPPVVSPSEKDKAKSEEWKRGAKKPSASVGDEDSLAEEQRKEKDLKKKASEKINNFLNAWLLLRPENVQSNPIAAATPTTDAKEHIAKQLGVDRRRIDTWFYRRRKKLKKQHIAAQADMPQTQTQAKPAKAKPPSISKNQFSINPNINLPSNHLRQQNQTALIAGTQVSMSINQQLPSTVQNSVAVGEGVPPQSSSKGVGLSGEAKAIFHTMAADNIQSGSIQRDDGQNTGQFWTGL